MNARMTIGLACLALVLCGCEKDNMWVQARAGTLGETEYFGDGLSARKPVEGTVPHGSFSEDTLLHQGLEGGVPATRYPFTITADLLDRGEDRYTIHCAQCHGAVGDGQSLLVQRGYRKPAPFADPRLLAKSPGELYRVLVSGVVRKANPEPDIIAGTGYDLRDTVHPVFGRKLSARDRWAVVAWMKVLQVSQSFRYEDLTPAEQERLNEPARSENGNR